MEKARYPANWKEIALQVKEAAGWRCAACGKKCRQPGEKLDTHKRTLTVHHIDHQPENCSRENLIALCTPCHLKADAQHHAESRKRRAAGMSEPKSVNVDAFDGNEDGGNDDV